MASQPELIAQSEDHPPKSKPTKAEMVPAPPMAVSVTPMQLLQIAVNKDADIGKLEALMNLQLKWEANEARKAFVEAMNAFKAEPPEILKNKHVAFGQTAYDHATLDQVCGAAGAGLSKHGISHRWRVEQTKDEIKVTCILTHTMGHSEETTLVAGADTSGSKNAIQAIGSAVTYLERYTLLAATGLAAKNGDNDGQGAAPQMDKLQEYLDSMSTAPNLNVLQTTFQAAWKEAFSKSNMPAMKMLVTARDARKKQIMAEEHRR